MGRRSGDSTQTALRAAHRHLLAWTRPAAGPRVGSAVGDLPRTKAALVAENAFLRQQLVVLARHVKRPLPTPADRLRLVLLARLVRGWRAALLIVQDALEMGRRVLATGVEDSVRPVCLTIKRRPSRS